MQYRPSLSISGRETRLSGGAAVLICNGPVALVLTVLVFIERDWRYCSLLLTPRRTCEDTGRLRLLRTAAPEGGTTNADAPRTVPIPTILLPEFDGCSPEAEPPLCFVLARAAATVSAGILIFSLYSREPIEWCKRYRLLIGVVGMPAVCCRLPERSNAGTPELKKRRGGANVDVGADDV